MNLWIDKIRQVIDDLKQQVSVAPSRSQTLPAKVAVPEAVMSKEEPKKRGFFTLKKK